MIDPHLHDVAGVDDVSIRARLDIIPSTVSWLVDLQRLHLRLVEDSDATGVCVMANRPRINLAGRIIPN
eukprot:SAG11_NODE_1859_length_4157_cov_6.963282_4_plen_69_part_00